MRSKKGSLRILISNKALDDANSIFYFLFLQTHTPLTIVTFCYPLQYSGLENSMDCIVHGVTKSQTQLSDFHFHSSLLTFGAVSLFNCSNLGWCVGNLTFLLIPVY